MTLLLSTKVKNVAMMCTALAIIVASAVYIIGEQQKIGGLRRHDHQNQYRDNKVSRTLRFISPVPWPDMGKETERKSLDRAQYAADHHEEDGDASDEFKAMADLIYKAPRGMEEPTFSRWQSVSGIDLEA